MADNLVFLAGPQALAMIKDGGLHPSQIDMMAGAAGGPKWLVLSHLDRVIFGLWLKDRPARPLPLIGASIGSWRFAAVSQSDPLAAIACFEAEYIHQSYSPRPSPTEITNEGYRIQGAFVPDSAIARIINHPIYRVHFLTVRCRSLLASENKLFQSLGFMAAGGLNLVSRSTQRLFFQRYLFHASRQAPAPILPLDFPVYLRPLTVENFRQVLAASGAIPLVMAGIPDIPGSRPGLYRDGGILDYHLDLAYNTTSGLVLFPHYCDRVTPGWFDKKLSGRKPRYLSRALVVAPSPDFVRRLPLGKIPDRDDFKLFQGRDHDRVSYWKQVVQACTGLGHEFLETMASGRIREKVSPL